MIYENYVRLRRYKKKKSDQETVEYVYFLTTFTVCVQNFGSKKGKLDTKKSTPLHDFTTKSRFSYSFESQYKNNRLSRE